MRDHRLSDHTTADDARRYRAQDEVSAAWALEPLAAAAFSGGSKPWSKRDEETLLADNQAAVSAAARLPVHPHRKRCPPCLTICTPNCRPTWPRNASNC